MEDPVRERQESDDVDGCDVDFTEETTEDSDIDGLLETNEPHTEAEEAEDALRSGDGPKTA